jgi:glycogen debranching enzyme
MRGLLAASMPKNSKARIPLLDVALPEGEPHDTADIHDALVIREGDLALFMDANGDVPAGNTRGLGVYHADTRHLSAFDLYFHTSAPLVLLSTAELGFSSEHVLTNPTLTTASGQVIPRGTIEVRRQRVVGEALEESLRVTNYHDQPVDLRLHLDLGADFANIFNVRGLQAGRRRRKVASNAKGRRIEYEYLGIDGKLRRTLVAFDVRPARISPSEAVFRLRLRHRQVWRMQIVVSVAADRERTDHARRDSFQGMWESYERWLSACTQVSTDNQYFNRALSRSLSDLRMLWLNSPDGSAFPVAGVPWFDALFGRDSLIMGFQTIAFQPAIASETLKALGRWQGTEVDLDRDEEPGKILHELRRGELSMSGGPAGRPYYGSIDSTLLFLMLIADYYAWTADERLIRQLGPNIVAAIDWLYNYGEEGRTGYVKYERKAPGGLENQGWKDSADAIAHADGRKAKPPIGLVEVQGYLYAVKSRLGPVLRLLGLDSRSERMAAEARSLRRRFHEDFWIPAERYYALAIDGDGEPCETVASNVGHALWCGLISHRRAGDVIERMLQDDLYSGWGIRTISERNPRYNPLGYHLGTVWPHDNSIAAFGAKMYGFEEETNHVASAMFDAAMSFQYLRLPECFGGEPRTAHHQPVPYPIACRPQGWSAGAIPMLLHAIMGLAPNAADGELRIVRPRLPIWLKRVTVNRLRVGRGEIDLLYERRGAKTVVEVTSSTRGTRVELVDRWPM